jgi:TetR/AcrR family transcriptional repressor of uid operon
MVTTQKYLKSIAKSNSPVKKTGEGNVLKKRLLKQSEEGLNKGREKILVAARACFSKQGFAGTSIKDIQDSAGFSRGNLYHHFKTKEEIVKIIIKQNLGIFYGRVELILNQLKDNELTLTNVINELARLAEDITKGPGRGMAFHVWSLAMVDSEVREVMTEFFEKIRSALEQKIILLMAQGKIKEFKNTQQLSVTLFGLVIPAFTLQSVFMDDKSLDAASYTESINLLFKESH